jgi:hypothetical protein
MFADQVSENCISPPFIGENQFRKATVARSLGRAAHSLVEFFNAGSGVRFTLIAKTRVKIS